MLSSGLSLPLLSCRAVTRAAAPVISPVPVYPPLLDHLVWLARDLDSACARFQSMTGIAPVYGGTHPSGTHNALVALGPTCYLEIASPQPGVTSGHPWIAAALSRPEPHFHAYCMRPAESLDVLASSARAALIPTIGPSAGSRTLPSGEQLRWRLLIPLVADSGGTIPFFIDWAESRHPAVDAAKGVLLTGFSLNHPHASRIQQALHVLAPGLQVNFSTAPSLVAKLRTPRGRVVLTS